MTEPLRLAISGKRRKKAGSLNEAFRPYFSQSFVRVPNPVP